MEKKNVKYIYTIKYYSAIATTWKELECIMVSEKNSDSPHLYGESIKKIKKKTDTENKQTAARGSRVVWDTGKMDKDG